MVYAAGCHPDVRVVLWFDRCGAAEFPDGRTVEVHDGDTSTIMKTAIK